MIRITAVCKVTDEAEVVVERDVILDNPTLTLEVRGWGGVPPPDKPVLGTPLDTRKQAEKAGFPWGYTQEPCVDRATLHLLYLCIVFVSSCTIPLPASQVLIV